jgi:pimeloyl-ACP methyl ester carboxylesterase
LDVSPKVYCSDVAEVVKAMGHERVHLVGHSFGGHIAFLVAAWNPDLVSSLVVVEADPDGPNPEVLDRVASWLLSWPRPFPDRKSAVRFFGTSASGSAWVEGLEERDGQYWPRFDDDVVLKALEALTVRSWWDDWVRITCPTWVVRGDGGALPLELANRMVADLPSASLVTIPGAGHEVHLDQPERLSQVLMQVRGSA